jgi:hypothetical protein
MIPICGGQGTAGINNPERLKEPPVPKTGQFKIRQIRQLLANLLMKIKQYFERSKHSAFATVNKQSLP